MGGGRKGARDAPRRPTQMLPMHGVISSRSAQSPSSALLRTAGVSPGEQGGEPAQVGRPAGESRLLPWAGKGGEGARVAGRASGLLERASEAEDCLTRCLAAKSRVRTAGYGARRSNYLARCLAGATAAGDWTYRANDRLRLTRGHRGHGESADSSRAGPPGPNPI